MRGNGNAGFAAGRFDVHRSSGRGEPFLDAGEPEVSLARSRMIDGVESLSAKDTLVLCGAVSAAAKGAATLEVSVASSSSVTGRFTATRRVKVC